MKPGRDALRDLIVQCGLPLTSAQYDQLWSYHTLLRSANAELNLTRIHNFENMVLKHYVDSLLVLKFEELPSPLMDMGSGPGLPGIPLKIAQPRVEMVLAEPRGARADFLGDVCRKLGLKGVEVFAGKIGPKFTGQFAGVITRAVAAIPETLDRVVNALEPGGKMLFMKGPDCNAEIAQAAQTHAELFRLSADYAYSIPGTTHERRLVVYERLEREPSTKTTVSFTGTIREASSEANPTFKLCRDVLTGRGVRKYGRAILAGPRLVAEVIERFPERVEAWLTDTQGPLPPVAGIDWIRFGDALFKTLDTSGTHAPLVLVRVPEMPEWSDDVPGADGCTLFVPFQDPENVGAVIRSAAAFGVARVVLLREAAHPFHPRSARAAGPALFQVPLWHGPSIEELRSRGPLIALATDGETIDGEPFPVRFGLVPGLEGPGLPSHLRNGTRRCIPIAPEVESLNAATATALALYVWSRGRSNVSGPGDVKPSEPREPRGEVLAE